MRRVFIVIAIIATIFAISCAGGGEQKERAPKAPSELAATGEGKNISLEWNDNSDNEDGFIIYRREAGDKADFNQIAKVGENEKSYTDSNLGTDASFEYQITAYNGAGESDPSNKAAAATIPNAPWNLLIHTVKKYHVNLTWDDRSKVEKGYYVERKSSGDWEKIATLDADAQEYQDGAASCETTYIYRVLAFNDAGESEPSNNRSARTVDCWTFWTVDATGPYYFYPKIAIDSNDVTHIVYIDSEYNIKHAKYDGSWNTELVASDDSDMIGFDIGENNDLFVSWQQYSTKHLMLSRYTTSSSSWSTDTIADGVHDLGFNNDVEIIPATNKPVIPYTDLTDKAFLVNISSGASWQTFTVDSDPVNGMGYYPAALAANENDISVAYTGGAPLILKYAQFNGSSWSTASLSYYSGYPDIAASSDFSEVGIVFVGMTGPLTVTVKLATNSGKSWDIEDVDDGYPQCSLAYDSNKNVHISYAWTENLISFRLRYATKVDDSWEIEDIDDIPGGYAPSPDSLAIDQNGYAHIAYVGQTATTEPLKYATNAEVK